MIKVKTTPNLYGISLIGDYQDLHELRESIGNYLLFYIENNKAYPYHEYEYLLSLNYDIRHAYMGSRGISIEKNNAEAVGEIAQTIFQIPAEAKKEFQSIHKNFKSGNLYFQVEILYPLVFHYMIALGLIIDDYYQRNWFENEDSDLYSYDIFDVEHDRAVIQHFIALLWNNVKDLFGAEAAASIFDYYENCEPYFLPSIYTDALLHCQMANFKEMDLDHKKQFLLLSLYELMDSDMLTEMQEKCGDNYEIYNNALQKLDKKNREIIPLKETFYASLENKFPAQKPMYRKDFDEFLDKTYGTVKEEEPEW